MRRQAGESAMLTVRIDPDVLSFYKIEAQRNGKTVSNYVRELLEAGHMVSQIEQTRLDMQEMLDQFKTDMININAARQLRLPDRVLKSIARSEVMLAEIIEGNSDKRLLYRLYDKALELVKRFDQQSDE